MAKLAVVVAAAICGNIIDLADTRVEQVLALR